MATTREDIWRILAVALLSCVGSFVTFYWTIGRNVATKPEIVEMIKVHTPYKEDAKLIHAKLSGVESTNQKLSDAINGLTRELATIRAVNEILLKDRRNGNGTDGNQ